MGRVFNFFSGFILFALSAISFFSCSQSLPEVRYASSSLIFDFSDEENPPEVRMGVYAETHSDVRRTEKMTASSDAGNFYWECSSPVLIQSGNTQWACITNMVMPEGEKIPQGKYTLIYQDSNSEETSAYFNVNYNEAFYEATSNDVPRMMQTVFGNKTILIYDQNDVLIYSGIRDEDIKEDRALWNRYRNARRYREVWTTPDTSVICLMPEVTLNFEINN